MTPEVSFEDAMEFSGEIYSCLHNLVIHFREAAEHIPNLPIQIIVHLSKGGTQFSENYRL